MGLAAEAAGESPGRTRRIGPLGAGQSPEAESMQSSFPSPLRGGAGVEGGQEAPLAVPSARPPPGPPLRSDHPPHQGEGTTKPLGGSQATALRPGARAPSRRSEARLVLRLPLVGVLLWGLTGVAAAATLKVDYRITLVGLTLGQADLEGNFDRDRYSLLLNAKLTGIAGLMSGSGRGGATAKGSLSGRRLVSGGFSATGRSGSAERTVQLGLEGGNANEVEIKPPFELRPDRVPLTEAHKRGVIDPLSALVAVAADPDKPFQAVNCDRTLPVFDGTQRFDVTLSYGETKAVKLPAYTGDVLVCNARYVPIAGHRPLRPAVKFMQDNRDMSAWLAPVAGTRFLVPVRISVRTTVGTSVVEAEKWVVTPGREAPSR